MIMFSSFFYCLKIVNTMAQTTQLNLTFYGVEINKYRIDTSIQGNAVTLSPADNTFDQLCSGGIECNIFASSSAIPFTYNYRTDNSNNPVWNPMNYTNNIVNPFGVYINSVYNYGDVCPTKLKTNGEIDPSRGKMMAYGNESKTLQDLIDNGDKEQILSYINNPTYSSAQVKNMIVALTPYISDTILKAVIARTSPLSYNDLKAVMISKSPLRDTVYNYLESIRPAVAANYTLVMQQNGISPMDYIQAQISGLHQKEEEEYNYLLYHYKSSCYQDSAEALIQEYGSDADKLNWAYKHADYTAAQAMIDNMKSNTQDEQDLKAIKQEEFYLKQENKYWRQADANTIAWLETLAQNNTASGAQAKTILHLINGEHYPEIILEDTLSNSFRIAEKKIKYAKANIDFIDCYPNPNDGNFTISITDGEWIENEMELRIENVLGQTLEIIQIPVLQKASNISMNYLPAGAYTIQVYSKEELMATTKFIIVKN